EESCSKESNLMCVFCRDYGVHKGHAHVLIERETDELREKLQESISELSKSLSKIDSWRRRMQTYSISVKIVLAKYSRVANELSNRERGPFGEALMQ
ncbi:hypothetical protein OSTOST_22093, partial [Ostertagia ostertagi]